MTRASLAALILAAGGGAVAVQGQTLGESTVTATITQRFEFNDNYSLREDPNPAAFSDTRFGLDYLRETSTQRLSLFGNLGLRLLWEDGEDFDVTYADPAVVGGRFGQDWADGDFDAYLIYSYRRLEGTLTPLNDFEFVPISPDALTDFDGNENRFRGGFDLALRTNSPSSYIFSLDASKVDYSNVDTDQTDSAVPRDVVRGEALWRLRLNPILSSAVVASYDWEKAENATDNEIRTAAIDAGFIYEPDENLEVTAGLGYEDRERLQTFSGERFTTENNWGPAVRGSIRYDTPEEFSLFASARYTTAAPDPRWNADLRADYFLPRGVLYARGYRDYGLNIDGDDTLFYGIGIGLEREINSLSSWGIDIGGRNEVDAENSEIAAIDRIDATARYTRALTQDVSATLGYRLGLQTEDGSAQSNAVFVTFGRSWSRRP